ncbi:MAG: hypothetical protein HYW01_04090 [Deltaproteobacteria bacterium]|nr:hypothetical protein [Deltaproteobacteria bacterium]
MKPIGVIFNPLAHINKNQSKSQINALKEVLGERAWVLSTKSKDEIPIALKEFNKEIKILAISGGDGTISSVLSSYINLFGDRNIPIIVPLKGGTINMIADDAGVSDNQITTCRELIGCIKSENELPTIERGLIRIIDKRFNHDNYAFTWIDGFLYRFIKWYRREGASVGVALKLILKSGIMSLTNPKDDLFKEVESKVYLNDKKLPFDSHLFIAAGSVKRLAFGFRIFTEEVEAGEEFSFFLYEASLFQESGVAASKGFICGR